MKRNLKYRLIFILVVVVGSIFLFYPPSEKVNLGLDLKGGIHLALQVLTNDAFEVEVNQLRERIEDDLQEKGIVFTRTQVTEDFGIEILGALQDQQQQLEDYLGQHSADWTYHIRFREGEVDVEMSMNIGAERALAVRTVEDAKETISRRVDQYGVAEPTIQVYGGGDIQDQIIVELPGVEDFDRVLNLIKSTARLELKLVHSANGGPYLTREAALTAFSNSFPSDYEILPYRNPTETGNQTRYMVVRKAPSITGQHLKNARPSQDNFTGRSEVEFFLNPEGVGLFTRVTEQNVGTRLAVVLDNEIRSAPNISERIPSEAARITGSFSPEQAEDLALVLRSGALPAAIRILENRIIGPSLGMDSIRRGIAASLVGLVLVVSGMLFVYRFSGINAIVCLILNLLVLLAVLASVHAALTLPGIAGIILTIGMAVDANILIFERIKEELRLGKTVRSAVDAGFDRVFSTILDTNITTLIAAVCLYQFGTGPVRGFAVTLGVGLLANIFTAVFVSRTLFGSILQLREVERLSI
ncbi:MAG: protein translocase subunit SecD [Acidobacteriota bacterium]